MGSLLSTPSTKSSARKTRGEFAMPFLHSCAPYCYVTLLVVASLIVLYAAQACAMWKTLPGGIGKAYCEQVGVGWRVLQNNNRQVLPPVGGGCVRSWTQTTVAG